MTLSQRLRTCAKHTGLDAVIELPQEAADEIDALQARAQVQGEPVYWEWRHLSTHPNTVDFGQWSEWQRVEARNPIFTAEDALAEFRAYIAQGYKYELRALYTTPQPAQATQAASAEDMKVYDSIADRYFREAAQAEDQQPAAQTEREAFEAEMRCEGTWGHRSLKRRPDGRYQNWRVDLMWDLWQARAPLHTHPAPSVPDDDFDLICNAIDKADTITMEGDYMLDSDDCIAVVRVMQVLLSVRAAMLAAKGPNQTAKRAATRKG